MSSLVFVKVSASLNDLIYTVNYSPLTRNISDLDLMKEIERLYFSVSNNIIELNYSNTEQEVEFHKSDFIIKLKGTICYYIK